MIKRLKDVYTGKKEIILYAIFGVITTLANLFTYLIFSSILGESFVLISNAIAWIVGVIVAFFTNKVYVFNSKSWKLRLALKEFAEFVAARLFSFGFEEFGMFLLVMVLHFPDIYVRVFNFTIPGDFTAKFILSVFVVIFNYFFSKFIIFKKNKENK